MNIAVNERGKTPMTKNVTVLSSEGNKIGVTYPKRAVGLVKKGRARYLDGDETVIVLAAPPDDITSQEDEMNNNFNFDEFIEKTIAAAKTAGETVCHVTESAADKAEAALNSAIAHLNDVITEYLERKESEDELEDELLELDDLSAEIDDLQYELDDLEDDLDDLDDIEDDNDKDESEASRIREKIEALNEKLREKTNNYEALARGKDAFKKAVYSAAEAVKDAAKHSYEAIKEAKKSEDGVSKSQTENCVVKLDENKTLDDKIDDLLRRINALSTESDDEYADIICNMPVAGPGDVATCAKIEALSKIMSERSARKAQAVQAQNDVLNRLIEERDRQNAEKQLSQKREMLYSLIDFIEASDENTDANVLAFYIRTAEKLAAEEGVMNFDIVTLVMENMLNEKDQNKLACYMKLIERM